MLSAQTPGIVMDDPRVLIRKLNAFQPPFEPSQKWQEWQTPERVAQDSAQASAQARRLQLYEEEQRARKKRFDEQEGLHKQEAILAAKQGGLIGRSSPGRTATSTGPIRRRTSEKTMRRRQDLLNIQTSNRINRSQERPANFHSQSPRIP